MGGIGLIERKIYFNDLIHALVDNKLADKFELWVDRNHPEGISYFVALSRLAADRGTDVLYKDIISGKFEKEISYEDSDNISYSDR